MVGVEHADGGAVSHGLCPRCAPSLMPPNAAMDPRVAGPDAVLLLDGLGVVVAASPMAAARLEKPLLRLPGATCGEVFACVNVQTSDRCGREAACAACAIRALVQRCFRTGRAEGPVRVDLVRRAGTGSERWPIEVSVAGSGAQVRLQFATVA
jgi:hypothetical protein